jgi:hypothetical protein
MSLSASLLRLGALAALVATASACSSGAPVDPTPPPATTGTIAGSISLPPGSPGSVENTRVAIYTSFADYNADRFAMQVPAAGGGAFSITGIVPGTYYMDAWKDNDGSGTFSNQDFYGVWGTLSASGTQLTPITVAAGSSTTISFAIQRIGGPTLTGKPAPMVVVVE